MARRQPKRTRGAVRLLAYLAESDERQAAFAKRVTEMQAALGLPFGATLDQATLSNYLHGHRTPSLLVAVLIELATEGMVRPQDWLHPSEAA